MYKCKESGLEVYENVEELFEKGITDAWDYQDNYYICVKSDDWYDNRIWIVNKKTKKISKMAFTKSFEILDKATPIDLETLKKSLLN